MLIDRNRKAIWVKGSKLKNRTGNLAVVSLVDDEITISSSFEELLDERLRVN